MLGVLQATLLYPGLNNGVLVLLSYIVINKNVLNRLVKGIDPHGLSATDGELILSPPGKDILVKTRHKTGKRKYLK